MHYLNIKTRKSSFLIVAVTYILAFLAAVLVFRLFQYLPMLYSTLLADIAATLVVWAIGIMFKNSSLYDPYWSIAPIAIIVFWLWSSPAAINAVHLLFLAAIMIWGIRLTLNWAFRWKGLHHQDWRYTQLRKNAPQWWFFTNLFGINLMPTLVVYLALIPAYYGLQHHGPVTIITKAGYLLCLAAVLVQATSDRQMDLFKLSGKAPSAHIDRGLWRYSRHPNYFGEVAFWWGIWLMQAGTLYFQWPTLAGPVAMAMLFMFISIPLMEKHILKAKPNYAHYQKQVSMIIPWPRFSPPEQQSQEG